MPSRRSVLVAGAAGLFAAGAGCTGVLDRSTAEPELRAIALRNTDDEAHALALRLSHEGETILDRTYELGPRTFDGEDADTETGETDHVVAIEDAWDSPAGEFRAAVRVDGERRAKFRLDDDVRPPTPYRYEIRVERDGGVSSWVTKLESTATK
ncbi:hypothetical protein M0R89_10195 [Halorussus limi]|uniref:Uncharacterized protein n=1 Tax=Halorussus limi TaxID=2938695 RepID=A0A8U0HPY4_9EURY|nr:hypothetical protein [Halorussus limi]UPV72919.1 hypothetical protein M0R89_10195 [Halorussus limi]